MGFEFTPFPRMVRYPSTPEKLNQFYNEMLAQDEYGEVVKKFASRGTGGESGIFGTIDDHDMGMNNGDKTFTHAAAAGVAFADFVGEAPGSSVRRRATEGKGVYGVKVIDFTDGDVGVVLNEKDGDVEPDMVGDKKAGRSIRKRTAAIFFLDCRTNKTPWSKGVEGWKKNYNGDFLGEEQWKWLERALANSDAEVNIVVNGLQVLSRLR